MSTKTSTPPKAAVKKAAPKATVVKTPLELLAEGVVRNAAGAFQYRETLVPAGDYTDPAVEANRAIALEAWNITRPAGMSKRQVSDALGFQSVRHFRRALNTAMDAQGIDRPRRSRAPKPVTVEVNAIPDTLKALGIKFTKAQLAQLQELGKPAEVTSAA